MKKRPEKEIAELIEQINSHNRQYHVENNPVVSDGEYDALHRRLLDLEEAHPHLKRPDSPTQKIGGMPVASFTTVVHPVPMLSIANTYSTEELLEFDRRVKKAVERDVIDYIVELKIDGVACRLVYEDGLFRLAATRGDGEKGDDVTENARTVRDLPLAVPYRGRLEVRGEIYMRRDDFEQFNRERKDAEEQLFANPRNATAGSLKLLDPKLVARRRLHLYVYAGAVEQDKPATHGEILAFLRKEGFPVNPHGNHARSIEEAIAYCEAWRGKRTGLPYNTDGMVIKVNSIPLQENLGSTAKSPRWIVAFKFPPEQATTRLLNVSCQVGRTGAITPVADLEPVFISGTNVSRATLHNFDEIKRLDIRIGDRVFVEKGGEVIPKIVKVVTEIRTGNEQKIPIPDHCPICGQPVVRDEMEVAIRCPNVRCTAQVKERILHFASRDAMDIRGMGESLVNLLVEKGLLSDYGDIYSLRTGDIEVLEGMGGKSAANLDVAIGESRNRPFANLIFALGIRHIGTRTAEFLAQRFASLDDLAGASEEELTAVPEIGMVIAQALSAFFHNEDNRRVIEKLVQAGVRTHRGEQEGKISDLLAGVTFVVTGILPSLSRDEIEQLIRGHGGRVSSAVSKKTGYVICGKEAGSKREKALQLGVQIITEQEFLHLIKK